MIIIKVVGVIIRDFEENNKKFVGLRKDLLDSFKDYNILLIGVPINCNFNKLKEIVNLCDGIVLSGGDNFLENDFLLIDYLYKIDMPTLGICLGMQSMGKYFSTKDEENVLNHSSNQHYVHYVNILKNSLLWKIVNKERILVNSRHNSALFDTKLKVSAVSDDLVIEAVEDDTKKFFLGLQWHPESLGDENSKKIFNYFINIIEKK